MDVKRSDEGVVRCSIADLRGRAGSGRFARACIGAVQDGDRVEIDCRDALAVPSSVIGTLLALTSIAADVKLTGVPDHFLDRLVMLNVHTMFSYE